MSRVHDALRRAEQFTADERAAAPQAPGIASAVLPPPTRQTAAAPALAPSVVDGLLDNIRDVAFNASGDAHLVDFTKPHEAPSEEFRTLRTRLNHLQSLQPIHSVVVTSPSPAEGKSFAAMNLALTESQLESNRTLLIDCDFRRATMHTMLQIERAPGLTDYLQGKAPLADCIRRVGGGNFYVMPAGESVLNPLELLNLREMRQLVEELPRVFNWVIIDSPPLLFAADANLLSTMADGAVLVVRIGTTTIDSVTRAMQSLCENNVLGIIVNGARRGELYSKYTYYHSYYYAQPEEKSDEPRKVDASD